MVILIIIYLLGVVAVLYYNLIKAISDMTDRAMVKVYRVLPLYSVFSILIYLVSIFGKSIPSIMLVRICLGRTKNIYYETLFTYAFIKCNERKTKFNSKEVSVRFARLYSK